MIINGNNNFALKKYCVSLSFLTRDHEAPKIFLAQQNAQFLITVVALLLTLTPERRTHEPYFYSRAWAKFSLLSFKEYFKMF